MEGEERMEKGVRHISMSGLRESVDREYLGHFREGVEVVSMFSECCYASAMGRFPRNK